jgi:hypothetical protein
MKLKTYLAMMPLGIVSAIAFAQVPCVSEAVPCEGSQAVHGFGCSTGCPPYSGGCCEYTTYRVNCDEGPDQYYTVRTCWEVKNCKPIVMPRKYECTVL